MDESFVVFSRAVLIYDRSTGMGFDEESAEETVKGNACRDETVGPPE